MTRIELFLVLIMISLAVIATELHWIQQALEK